MPDGSNKVARAVTEHLHARPALPSDRGSTNVARHAQGAEVVLDVEAIGGVVRVSVSDEGIGGADPSRGSGLLGLGDRVDALGGTMTLSSPPSGTALLVELPIWRDG